MGIIKSLFNIIGKTVVFVSETPIPEYAGLISAIVDVVAIADAFDTVPYEEVAENLDDSGCAYIHKAQKTNPIEVMDHFCIFSDNFSVREGVRKYRQLDVDGKAIFTAEAISLGLKALYFTGTTVRFFRAMQKCNKYVDLYNRERAAHNHTLATVDFIDNGIRKVVESMTPHTGEFNNRDRINYDNYINISADLESILRTVSNERKAVAA